ncbi:hypothetical protein TrLO_g8512 [Triparma laevis f. longispina]|uniref:TLC domain-containing protein n=1 Tax=Triparma laevis f. longispina TaxID=1714387 RepID=A0A9W7F3E5_9STRA|nr:hypothetical protein TrLO_g8512 [Triparma laevis f. longispina]
MLLLSLLPFSASASASSIPKMSGFGSPTTTLLSPSVDGLSLPLRTLRGGAINRSLPSFSTMSPIQISLTTGLALILLQTLLQNLLLRSSFPVLNKKPGYLAHTLIVVPLMTFVSLFGLFGYLFDFPQNVASPVLSNLPNAKILASILSGIMIWDVPTSYAVPGLRSSDILIHHSLLFFISILAAMKLSSYWCYFYFGVVELVSPPLSVYDQLERCTEIAEECKDKNLEKLKKWRDSWKVIAAVTFTITRAGMFTFVTWFKFLPQCMKALSIANPVQKAVIQFMSVMVVGFSALQLWWFSLLVKEAAKGF